MSEEAEERVTSQIKDNSKVFFSYVRKYGKLKTKIGPLKGDETYTSDSKRMAEILNYQYKDMFCYIKDSYSPNTRPSDYE